MGRFIPFSMAMLNYYSVSPLENSENIIYKWTKDGEISWISSAMYVCVI